MTDQWQCLKCGKRGDFELMGMGFIKCPVCGSVHFVLNGGELKLCLETC